MALRAGGATGNQRPLVQPHFKTHRPWAIEPSPDTPPEMTNAYPGTACGILRWCECSKETLYERQNEPQTQVTVAEVPVATVTNIFKHKATECDVAW